MRDLFQILRCVEAVLLYGNIMGVNAIYSIPVSVQGQLRGAAVIE